MSAAEVAQRVVADAIRSAAADGRTVERPEHAALHALRALATSPDVREALEEADVPCLHAPHLTCAPGDDLFHPECLLAALADADQDAMAGHLYDERGGAPWPNCG